MGWRDLAAIQRRTAIGSINAYRIVSYDTLTVVARTDLIDLMALTATTRSKPEGRWDRRRQMMREEPRTIWHRQRHEKNLSWWWNEQETPTISSAHEQQTQVDPVIDFSGHVKPVNEKIARRNVLLPHSADDETQLFLQWFLQRIDRAPLVKCSYYGPLNDNVWGGRRAPHARTYEAFESDRKRLVQCIRWFKPSDLVSRVLKSPANWKVVTRFVDSVIETKKDAEH